MLRRILCAMMALLCLLPALAEAFRVVDAPVFRETLTSETVPLRFYDDMPHVPCMGLRDYYRLMLGQDMAVEIQGDGTSVFTAPNGATATVNTDAGTLTSDDYLHFSSLMEAICPGMEPQYLDAAAFTRPAGLGFSEPIRPVTLDFRRYGIPVHAGEDDVFMPLATLSDMFVNLAYYYASWNGKNVYINLDNLDQPAGERDPDYYAPIAALTERPEDLAVFSYGELCFVMDTFYGHPGSAPLEAVLAERGFDGALEAYSDESREVRRLLKSRRLGEYIAGAERLNTLLYDGGHTHMSLLDFADERFSAPEWHDAWADFNGCSNQMNMMAYYAPMLGKLLQKQALRKARGEAYGDSQYVAQGDTAVVCLDSFMYDFDGWADYYAGSGDMPDDDVRLVFEALEQASRNPDIRHFVFDISCNPGGSADFVMAVMALISGDASFGADYVVTGQNYRSLYTVDLNLDGAFDERDSTVRYDFNFGVLTSEHSFSCGNLLPALMRDKGFMVLGERSGGGTCAVEKHATPEGLTYQISSGLSRLTDAGGHSIEDGIPVDAKLVKRGKNGKKDYSDFYDLDALSRAMNAFYGGAELMPAA